MHLNETQSGPFQTDARALLETLERIQDGVLALDSRMVCTYINRQGGKLLGQAPEDLLGKNLWTELRHLHNSDFAQACIHAMQIQKPVHLETNKGLLNRPGIYDIDPGENGLTIRFRETPEQLLPHSLKQVTAHLRTNTESLVQISSSLIQIEKFKDAIQRAADLIAQVLEYDRVTIITFDVKQRQVTGTYAGGVGMGNVIVVSYEELWEGLSGWVLRERKPALSPKGKLDDRESPAVQKRRQETNCGAIVVVPVLSQGNSLGTITVINRPEERDLTQVDVDLLMVLSNQIAALIENNRLYLSLAEEVKTRQEIQARIQQAQVELEYRIEQRTADLRVANRALRAISDCNQVLIRSQSEHELMTNICQILITTGGYHLAWIGFVEHDEAKSVRPVAWAGFEDGYLDSVRITWADTERGHGPTGTAARTRQIAIARDILNDPNFAPWRAQALVRGYQSVIGLPLLNGSNVLGVLTIYSAHTEVFNENEQTLLKELASDIVYGLIALRTHTAQIQSEERFSKAFRLNPTAMSITRQSDGQVIEVNESFLNLTGYQRDEIIGKRYPDLHLTTFPDQTAAEFEKRLEQGHSFQNVETAIQVRNGAIKQVILSMDLIHLGDEPHRLCTMMDITDRKQMEEALHQSEAKYRLVSENTADVIWTVDVASLRFTYITPSIKKMSGYSVQEMLGRTVVDILKPEHRDSIAASIAIQAQAALKTPTSISQTNEVEQICKDGATITVEVSYTFVVNEAGQLHMVGVSRDITERKRMEIAIRERVKELTCLYEVSRLLENEAISEQDLCRQTADLLVASMQFYHAAAAVVTLDRQHYHTDLYSHTLAHHLSAAITVNGVLRGQVAVYYTQDLPFILPEEQNLLDNLARMLGLWLERKQSQTALRESNERFRQIAENIQEVFWIHDLSQQVMLYVSPAYEKIWGRTCHSLAQNPGEYLESIMPEDRPIYLESLRKQMAGLHTEVEYRIKRQDNSIRWIWDRSFPILGEPGASARSAGVATDITLEKTARQELEELNRTLERRVQERTAELAHSRDELSMANAALEKASRLKDEFLASMSHELRTPLTGILGLSEVLQLRTYGDLNEKQLKAIKTIENSGRHLLDLINDILDLSKIEAGKLELQLESCSVTEICQACLQLVKGLAHQKRLNVSFSINTTSMYLRADPRRLKQMLVNLLSNAIKFTPDGGSLGLEIRGDEAEKTARLTVWDRGIGIKLEDMNKLFKAFVQIDSSLSRQYSGTGLGLALVHRLTEMHGGSVEVNSVYGEGSRFTLVLPWESSESGWAPAPPSTPSEKDLQSLKNSLTIEDNELDAEHITRYLHMLGIQNVVHAVAQGAVEKAALVNPCVILLDLFLPDGSGMDVLAMLKADERTRSIPVVVTSADERRSEAMGLGAVGYLVKPFTHQELRAELARISRLVCSSEPVMVIAPKASPAPVILVADDNEMVLTILSDYFKANHYQVITVRSGYELLDRSVEIHPDIMLVDIQMPGMDGMEAIRRVRAHQERAIAAAPIIAITALAMTGDRERILAAGADDYMSKPLSLSRLKARVSELLQHRQ